MTRRKPILIVIAILIASSVHAGPPIRIPWFTPRPRPRPIEIPRTPRPIEPIRPERPFRTPPFPEDLNPFRLPTRPGRNPFPGLADPVPDPPVSPRAKSPGRLKEPRLPVPTHNDPFGDVLAKRGFGRTPSQLFATEHLVEFARSLKPGSGPKVTMRRVASVDGSGSIEVTLLVVDGPGGAKAGTWWFHEYGLGGMPPIAPEAHSIRRNLTKQLELQEALAHEKLQTLEEISTFRKTLDEYKNPDQLTLDPKTPIDLVDIPASHVRIVMDDIAELTSSRALTFRRVDGALPAELEVVSRDVAKLDEGTVIIHSNDAKTFVVGRKLDDAHVTLVTRDPEDVTRLVGFRLGNQTVVLQGRKPQIDLGKGNIILRRAPGSRLPLEKSVDLLNSKRAINPRQVASGLPQTKTDMVAQGLDADALAGYRALHAEVSQLADSLGLRVVAGKKDIMRLLRSGNDDLGVIVAHSDGKRIFLGDEVVTLDELAKMQARRTPSQRVIILASCETGIQTTNLASFAELIVEKGYAGLVVAPERTIYSEDIRELFSALKKSLRDFLDAVSPSKGRWRVHGMRAAKKSTTSPA